MLRFHFLWLALSLLPLAGCGPEKSTQPAPRPAIVQHVTLSSPAMQWVYSGTIHARHATQLSFRVGGQISSRNADIGDHVKAGEVLAKLDAHDIRLEMQATEARLQTVRQQYALAKSRYKRAQSLWKDDSISRAVFDQRKSQYQVTQSQLEQARKQLSLQRNKLGYTQLKAQRDGIITRVMAATGQVVSAGQPVFGFAGTAAGTRELWIAVPGNRIDSIHPGEKVGIRFWALPNIHSTGKVRSVAGSADPATRTYRVKIKLNSPPDSIRLGMSATARLHTEQPHTTTQQVIRLPLTALYHIQKQPAVWIVDKHTRRVRLQRVHILSYRDNAALLTYTKGGGLQPGDAVVIKGVNKLHKGETINPQPVASVPAVKGVH